MNNLAFLAKRLREFVALEGQKTREEIAGYIVGELICDYDRRYEDLERDRVDVERIGDLASDLEWSNGSPDDLESMWQELKSLILALN